MAKKKASQEIKGAVKGDVSGQQNIAGRDVTIQNNYQGLPEERQRHVPVTPPDLLGRAVEFRAVMRSLDQGHAALIVGLGGMGKTALAAAVGVAALAEKQGKTYRYPDGVLWLTVLDHTVAQLCDTVFRRKGQEEWTRAQVSEKPGLARDLLGGLRLVVVLDDVNVDNPAAREWLKQAQPPGAPLLVTSREALPGFDATPVEVKELDRADAIRLLRKHAGEKTGAKLDGAAAGALCEKLGDHPLALELLGEHLRRYYEDDPQAALAMLDRAHEAIREIDRPDSYESKDDSVFVSLRLSWDRLDDKEQLLLARLAACFAIATGDELLRQASGLTGKTYRTVTGDLKAQGLIRKVGKKWGVHALVGAFVRAVLGEDGWKDTRRTVVKACVSYAEAHNGTDVASGDLLEAELRNLLGAAQWAADEAMNEAVGQLATNLWGNSEMMSLRGYASEAVPLLQAGARAARVLGWRQGEGAYLGNLGNAYSRLGQVEQAIEYFHQALAIDRDIKDPQGEGNALGNLGIAYAELGQVEQAIEYFRQALAIDREIKDRIGEGNALGNLGEAYYWLGHVEQAIEYSQQALALRRKIKDRGGESQDLTNLGVAYESLGKVKEAMEYYQQALAIERKIKDRRGEGNSLGNLGSAYAALGQIEKAIEYLEEALAIAREIEDRRGEGNALGNLGNSYLSWGQVEQAIKYHEQALAIAREIKDRRGEGLNLLNLGLAHGWQGEIAEAIHSIEQARAIFVEIKSPHVKNCDEALARLRGKA